MNYAKFREITRKGNFVAWFDDYYKVTAIALMTDNNWFNVAINCMRDGDMGEKDADGVYERKWATDSVSIEHNPRLATTKEIYLYLFKVGGLQEALGFDYEDWDMMCPALVDNRVVFNYDSENNERTFNSFIKARCSDIIDNLLNEFWKGETK